MAYQGHNKTHKSQSKDADYGMYCYRRYILYPPDNSVDY